MGRNLAKKILGAHLVDGKLVTGQEIGIRIDHALLQDATGTMAMLEFEALGLDSVQIEMAAQYVDHNIIQSDYKNADDHAYLQSACARYGIHFSPPGNGISHQVHMERFSAPGKTMLGSDSHTPSAAGLSMLGIGAGGLDVALAMAGRPYYLPCPKVLGVKLTGELPDWVSAKDVILEMLRRHDVKGCMGKIIEYYGPGVKSLSATDRETIGNWVRNWELPVRSFLLTKIPVPTWSHRAGDRSGCHLPLMKMLSTMSMTRLTSDNLSLLLPVLPRRETWFRSGR